MEWQTPSSDKRQPIKESPPHPSPPSSLSSPSVTNIRLWRPAAQRNLRNQWSKLASLWHDWVSNSSTARTHATALVNSYLSQMYMDAMELGVLSDIPGIRKKASLKLFKQQELQRDKLLSSYKDLLPWGSPRPSNWQALLHDGPQVGVVTQMVNTSTSMRCYLKGMSNSPLAQFSSSAEFQNDTGDAGGVPVFTFWPISLFEKVAKDFVEMFISELNLKRLLLMELLSLSEESISEINSLDWSNEFYLGELDDLQICSLYSNKDSNPVLPSLTKCNPESPSLHPQCKQDQDVLQVYLTSWIAEVNIEQSRLDEILAVVGAEMHVNIS